MNQKISKLVADLKKKYGTNDPYEIASYLNVNILSIPLDDVAAGFYKLINRRKYIFLNSDINDQTFLKVVLAHELGHATLHPKENCAFMNKHTLLLTSKIERQANIFAAYLLIEEDILKGFEGCSWEQFNNCTGYPKELLELWLEEREGLYGIDKMS